MLNTDEARILADEFRPRFSSVETFEESWRRCWEKLRQPTLDAATKWLTEDLARDGVFAQGLSREPLLPVRQDFALSDCRHCGGTGYVRDELPVDASGFGRARRCPACADPEHSQHCYACTHFLGGYLGPDTPVVSAEVISIA